MASMANALEAMAEVAPRFRELTDDLLFGEIWERPHLSKRERSMIVVATLIALYRTDQIGNYIRRAMRNGVTREEIGEIITQTAFYAGWPNGVTAAMQAKDVFDEQ
jgi:4-carboxymuconolactone decarboxylase